MKILKIQDGGRLPFCKNCFYQQLKFCTVKRTGMAIGQVTKTLNFENSRWRTVAILQIDKSASGFDEIWYTCADLELDESQITKYENF